MNSLSNLLNNNHSLWLENITRVQLENGLLLEYLQEGSIKIKGISVNPRACAHALRTTGVYDNAIRKRLKEGLFGEPLALELIIEDACYACDLLRSVFDQSNGIDGWVALTIFPMSITDTVSMITAISVLYAKAPRANIIITIPGLPEWLEAFEEAIFLGIPITLAFLLSPEQLLAAAKAYLRGVERRIISRLDPVVTSFARISFSRLVTVFSAETATDTSSPMAIGMARKIYEAARDLYISPEWRRIFTVGARPLWLIWKTDTLCDYALLSDFLIRGNVEPSTVAVTTDNSAQALLNTNFSDTQISICGKGSEKLHSQYLQEGSELHSLTERLQKNALTSLTGGCIELLDALSYKSALITGR